MGAIDWVGRRSGQAMLGVMFVKLGSDAARSPGPRVQKAATLDLPVEPELAVRLNGAAMVAGGAALTLNKLPRLAALGLLASLIPTTMAGHSFWEMEGADRKAQEIQFYKNLGLFGGLLVVLTRRAA
jgi:putative oxidoreductase